MRKREDVLEKLRSIVNEVRQSDPDLGPMQ